MATKEQVEAALIEWGDDVSATADALGVHRNQVYNWVTQFKIDREALRAVALVHNLPTSAQLASARTAVPNRKGAHLSQVHARKSSGLSGLPLTGRDGAPTFAAMPATAEKEPPVVAPPVKATPRPTKPLRLKPALEGDFERGRLRLSAELGYDVDRLELFNQLVERSMPGFFEELLKNVRAAAKRPAPKGGQE